MSSVTTCCLYLRILLAFIIYQALNMKPFYMALMTYRPYCERFVFARLRVLLIGLSLLMPLEAKSRLAEVKERVSSGLNQDLARTGLSLGNPVYLRVFKAERRLELWMQPKGHEQYKLYNTYPIAGMSGELGPKLKEGDRQAPEGFYNIVKGNLNPQSRYHLSFNIGYPNKYDKAHGRTGSFIMVHGSDQSIGCYAMTDPVIEVIYLIVEATLNNGQKFVPFHSFPFRYKENWEGQIRSIWNPFWKELEPAYWIFQKEKRPPLVKVEGGHYIVR